MKNHPKHPNCLALFGPTSSSVMFSLKHVPLFGGVQSTFGWSEVQQKYNKKKALTCLNLSILLNRWFVWCESPDRFGYHSQKKQLFHGAPRCVHAYNRWNIGFSQPPNVGSGWKVGFFRGVKSHNTYTWYEWKSRYNPYIQVYIHDMVLSRTNHIWLSKQVWIVYQPGYC